MKRKVYILLLLSIACFKSYGQSDTILLIRFNETGGENRSKLLFIEEILAGELRAKGYVVMGYSNDMWMTERSFDGRKVIIDRKNASYSIALEYAHDNIALYMKKWRNAQYYLPPTDVSSANLNTFTEDSDMIDQAVDWAREVEYYFKYDKIRRPTIAIDDFIVSGDQNDPQILNLSEKLRENILREYLKFNISTCLKLKAYRFSDRCTIMYGELAKADRNIKVSIEFEKDDGETAQDEYSHPGIPIRDRDIAKLSRNIINSIEWPQNLICHE